MISSLLATYMFTKVLLDDKKPQRTLRKKGRDSKEEERDSKEEERDSKEEERDSKEVYSRYRRDQDLKRILAKEKKIKESLFIAEKKEEEGKSEEAIEDYTKIKYYGRIESIYLRGGRYNDLITLFEILGAESGRNEETQQSDYAEAGFYCLKIGDYIRAIKNYERARNFYTAGKIAEEHQDFERAVENYKKIWFSGGDSRTQSLIDKINDNGRKEKLKESLWKFLEKEAPWTLDNRSYEKIKPTSNRGGK